MRLVGNEKTLPTLHKIGLYKSLSQNVGWAKFFFAHLTDDGGQLGSLRKSENLTVRSKRAEVPF